MNATSRIGKVYLVGAGPGHPQLLTLKALELIRTGDVIIYDRLIQEEILDAARADAELIYVGKKPGLHQSRQEEINAIIAGAARRAAIVVRLKGGDPVLFGRGGEEAEYLAGRGVPFEVVPGVTAGLSVPMAAGIPVTHRDYAHGVALVTGHRRDDKDTREPQWEALARMDTLVFFMSVGKLPEIAQRLVAHGRSPDTPAAVVQMGYWPGEQTVVGTLATLPALAEERQVRPPATIVVGEVVRLREKLTTLHRDLRRDVCKAGGFGLSAETLLARVASGLRVARDVLAAVSLGLFDDLEEETTLDAYAARRGFRSDALAQMLRRLASLGLLVRCEDRWVNAEAASRFLRRDSEEQVIDQLEALVVEAEAYDPVAVLRGA